MLDVVSNLFESIEKFMCFCSTYVISKLKLQGLLRQNMHVIYLKDNCCR